MNPVILRDIEKASGGMCTLLNDSACAMDAWELSDTGGGKEVPSDENGPLRPPNQD